MSKWEVVQQYPGITNNMKINILSILRTAIDIHGSSKMYETCKEVKNWLEQTYGKLDYNLVSTNGLIRSENVNDSNNETNNIIYLHCN
ncbi:hypothetical protein I4U23_016915 [Adineta vaga]|nr:hypothetical protein I4U23_016915 [Adineta vaga]